MSLSISLTNQHATMTNLEIKNRAPVNVWHWMGTGLLLTLLAIAGCQQGDPGPAGPDGNNGTNGVNGANGGDGKNGADYNEASQNGYIITYLDGKTPAGVTFRDTLHFKFSSTDLNESSVYHYSANDVYFKLERFTALDNWNIQNYTDFNIEVYDNGAGDTTWFIDQHLKTTATTTDFKYFAIDDDYYDGEGSNVSTASYDGFKYNSSTGRLYLRYSWTVPANSNRTGFDLNVSGVMDVTVYESITD